MLEVHVLASGSDGNCTVIEYDDEAVMIDAGVSCRKIVKYMDQEGVDVRKIKALLLTHEHTDHILGAGPAARKFNLPIYCNRGTFDASSLGAVEYREIRTSCSFTVGTMNITPLPISHNAVDPNAFLVEKEGKKALLATDMGKITYQVEQALAEADIAVVESNYDRKMLTEGPYPLYLKRIIGSEQGHMSNVDCAAALKRTMNPNRQVFLAHLSKTNNTPDTAREEVSQITGIKRMKLDCLEFQGDTRTLKL